MSRTAPSVTKEIVAFVVAGLIVLLLVGIVGVFVLRRIGTAEAMREAENLTAVAARGVVEPRLTDGILHENADSLVAIDAVVNGSEARPGVLREPIARVKLWDPSGVILYSDDADLIGSRFTLDANQRAALGGGAVAGELSDTNAAQNRSERGMGPLVDVSVPVRTPDGHQLLFESSIRFDSVAASARRLWISFLPVLAVALVALALLQIPLAYRLARRVERSQQDREQLLQRAIDSSDLERRRIAADLHDGSVQQLAGVSMSLSAAADSLSERDPAASAALRDAASKTRQGMRSLRSAVMGIYPPDLQRAGLATALSDLVASLNDEGIETTIEVPATIDLPLETESLLFRTSQEAIRNVVTHAHAHHVSMVLTPAQDRATLEIRDDGVGFSDEEGEHARVNGHVGLKLLGDLARDAGGELSVASTPGEGTVLRLEVPRR